MDTIVKTRCRVLPGNRVEVTVPEVEVGEEVEVTVAARRRMPKRPRRSMQEILAEFPPPGLFKTPKEVDEYLKAERDSWD